MPVICHFRDCKALLSMCSSWSSAISNTWPLPLTEELGETNLRPPQWAADTTHWLLMRLPPQKCLPSVWSETIHGQLWGTASIPPTTRMSTLGAIAGMPQLSSPVWRHQSPVDEANFISDLFCVGLILNTTSEFFFRILQNNFVNLRLCRIKKS